MTERYAVVNGWLVENVNHHTCGAGTADTGYAHEPGCGWEPIARVEDLLAQTGTENREPCKAEIHSWSYFTPEQVDSCWIRCDRLGPHDEHENSDTGATWRDGRGAA